MEYNHLEIEKKWQDFWDKNKVFKAEINNNQEKYYVLDMFPYPSGSGLHVGHPEGYTATDIVSRLKRMKGKNVLHPMGWDAFGLPAENYAIKTGVHPKKSTQENIKTFKRQIKSLGFSYDWDREINTTDPNYYKWTQWIFKQLFLKNLAYEKEMLMNWCPTCKIVVANEEVENGVHERCECPVEKKKTKQWMLRITAYTEKLLKDLETLDWSDSIIEMQKNWIGKSEGANVFFEIEGFEEKLEVYTTRPDTLFGCTYMVLSPEHPLVEKITTKKYQAEVKDYLVKTAKKSERERKIDEKEKTGVFTGTYAINPVNEQKIPIYIADYVLMDYGTGAIMAVPAHDLRDNEFAKKYQIKIVEVIKNSNNEEVVLEGEMINSKFLDGLNSSLAKKKMIQYLEEKKLGEKKVNYKLRDWVFTRQRYWGEPIPLIHGEDGKIYSLADSELPLVLPEVSKYEPTEDGESPLAQNEDWVNVRFDLNAEGEAILSDNGKLKGKRETSTMPNWAGSSWYWLAYLDPNNNKELLSQTKEKYWGQVDLYVGGAEHAVLHLLYARFWHKFLYDLGVVSSVEPFQKLRNQGMILAFSYKNEFGKYFHPSEVEEKNGEFFSKTDQKKLVAEVEKMSKSKNNVVNPDDVIKEYGADSLRLYVMFIGPFEQTVVWDTKGILGVRRFLEKVWRIQTKIKDIEISDNLNKKLHQTIKKVDEDTENFKFNTAISSMMVFVNDLSKEKIVPQKLWSDFLKILSPYAPHITEELWSLLGNTKTIAYEKYPQVNLDFLKEDKIKIIVQVNGKLRASLEVDKSLNKEELLSLAKEEQNVSKFLNGKIIKEIYVPNKLVNFVVKKEED
jgi:leucyl-tRNA synthetase